MKTKQVKRKKPRKHSHYGRTFTATEMVVLGQKKFETIDSAELAEFRCSQGCGKFVEKAGTPCSPECLGLFEMRCVLCRGVFKVPRKKGSARTTCPYPNCGIQQQNELLRNILDKSC